MGKKIIIEENTRTYSTVKNDRYLNTQIIRVLNDAEGNQVNITDIPLNFYNSGNSDLKYGIGLAKASLNGVKENGVRRRK